MSYDDDEYLYEMDAAMQQLEEDVLERTSVENVTGYLGKYGDAITERIHSCRDIASSLLLSKYYAASLITSVIGIELTIRFLLVRPIVQGAFLPNELATMLTARIGLARSYDDRKLLPALLKNYDIELGLLKLPSGEVLWKVFQKDAMESRNRAVHMGDPCSESEAQKALLCLTEFENQLVKSIAQKLGFSLERTGRWCRVEYGDPKDPTKPSGAKSYDPESPFVM
jgi:hypothetical protein